MINKYNNPRLHNTVLTGPGMAHPRNPHVVIGSEEKGFIQGDLMDANAVMETIDQKIDVDNLLDQEKLNSAIQDAVDTVTEQIGSTLDEIENTLETKADKEYVDNAISNIPIPSQDDQPSSSWPIITDPHRTRVEKEIPISIIMSDINTFCNYIVEQWNDYFYNNTENPSPDEVDLVFYTTNREGNKFMEHRFNPNCPFDDTSSGYITEVDHEYINILTNNLGDTDDTTDPHWYNNTALALDLRYFLRIPDDYSGILYDIVIPYYHSDSSNNDIGTISLEELCVIDQILMFYLGGCKVYHKSYNNVSNIVSTELGVISGKIFWNNVTSDPNTPGQLVFSQIVCDILLLIVLGTYYEKPHYTVTNEIITTSAE